MNTRSTKLLILSLLVFLAYACVKPPKEEITEEIIEDVEIPSDFSWATSRTIKFDISINDNRFKDASHRISIYRGNPFSGGTVLARGAASETLSFQTSLYLADTLKEVYLLKTAPDLSTSMQKVALNAANISVALGAVTPPSVSAKTSVKRVSATPASPDCTSGCTQTISSNNTNINTNSGDVVCITGSNITVGFNANGGTIRICGSNVTVQNASLNNSAKIIIASSASVRFSNLNTNSTTASIQNFGNVSINGSFAVRGVFENYGTFSTTGDFDLNDGSTFSNDGTITVAGSMNARSNSAVNNGSITTNSHFQLNGGSSFINKCYLYVKGNYNLNGTFNNYNFVKVTNETTINGNSKLNLYNNAMLTTGRMMLNKVIEGFGLTSLVKVSGNTTINSGGGVTGAVQYWSTNGQNLNDSFFSNGAVEGHSVYIPVSGCNAEGNGSPSIADDDNDGVANNLDKYPNDPSKAFDNFYPSEKPEDGTTIAFEDNWPRQGDYDLNDLVIALNYKIVTNAQNKVVQVNGTYSLYATGGSSGNGFAVAFPVSRSSVKNFTGGVLEAGQDSAVAVIFTDMRKEMQEWNTYPKQPNSGSKNYSISFDVENGPSISSFGLGIYNPFSWNGAYGRGYEIHLKGYRPTKLADFSAFGKDVDGTDPANNKYYETKEGGLPWGIAIPTAHFVYPVETVPINKAYRYFNYWAAGMGYLDWYVDKPGYRDNGAMYGK
ncbi:LruC domain-containing protein [Pedobacter sp. SYSU D00535]|uniref:LruC domain-containing protein n=1 Tax=Pedobacter sp. SYSU D00535 TaxID=2810308 RepID=UPI001A974B9C|nr:LruC domain-containing protein [Pedobacter sp. SYSU D00535]